MLLWITKQIVISLLIIVLAHSIYMFLKTNLTTPKIRDLVNKPKADYDKIYENINLKGENEEIKNPNKTTIEEEKNMKSELQNYLKELSVNTKRKDISSANFTDNFSSQYQNIETL